MRCAFTSAIAAATPPSSVSSMAPGWRARPAAAGASAAGSLGGRRGAAPPRVAVAALERLEQAEQAGMGGDELAVAALEELAPLLRDRVGILEVVLEQEPGVARVQAVDVVRTHMSSRAGSA